MIIIMIIIKINYRIKRLYVCLHDDVSVSSACKLPMKFEPVKDKTHPNLN